MPELQGATPSANPLLADTNVTDAGWNPAGTGWVPSAELADAVGVVAVLADEADAGDAAVEAATGDEPPATAELEAFCAPPGCW